MKKLKELAKTPKPSSNPSLSEQIATLKHISRCVSKITDVLQKARDRR